MDGVTTEETTTAGAITAVAGSVSRTNGAETTGPITTTIAAVGIGTIDGVTTITTGTDVARTAGTKLSPSKIFQLGEGTCTNRRPRFFSMSAARPGAFLSAGRQGRDGIHL